MNINIITCLPVFCALFFSVQILVNESVSSSPCRGTLISGKCRRKLMTIQRNWAAINQFQLGHKQRNKIQLNGRDSVSASIVCECVRCLCLCSDSVHVWYKLNTILSEIRIVCLDASVCACVCVSLTGALLPLRTTHPVRVWCVHCAQNLSELKQKGGKLRGIEHTQWKSGIVSFYLSLDQH